MSFFSQEIETMDRGELDALVDERIRYTVQFGCGKFSLLSQMVRTNKIDPNH